MKKSLFLTTCARCGSWWVRKILVDLVDLSPISEDWTGAGRFAELAARVALMEGERPGGRLYMRHQPLDTLIPVREHLDVIALVRDPRDVLISTCYYYMSKRGTEQEEQIRQHLNIADLDRFEPIFAVMIGRIHNVYWFDGYLAGRGQVKHSLIRYEDMILDAEGTISLALERLGRIFNAARLPAILQKHSFERLSGGRHRGEERTGSHYRKGIVGDWRSYFSEAQNRRYYEQFARYFQVFGYPLEGMDWS